MLIGLGSGKYTSRKLDSILSTSNPLFLFSYLYFPFPESFVIGLITNGSGPSQTATSFRPQHPDNNHSPCFWTESCSKLRRERVLLQKAHSSFERGAKKQMKPVSVTQESRSVFWAKVGCAGKWEFRDLYHPELLLNTLLVFGQSNRLFLQIRFSKNTSNHYFLLLKSPLKSEYKLSLERNKNILVTFSPT